MRVAVVSDLHANREALDAVEADLDKIDADLGKVDAVWCLGDVVGYGPDPVACLDWVRARCAVVIPGNHDWAAIGQLDLEEFNDAAAAAARWTRAQLSDADVAYLASLPLTARAPVGSAGLIVTLAHGSPRDPIWEYLLEPEDALDNFDHFEDPLGLVGHSHVPVAFHLENSPADRPVRLSVERARYDAAVPLGTARHLVNVGSVGQPRDGDPAARYLILDPDRREFSWRRVSYDVRATQRKMRDIGLPEGLWRRLAYGR